MMQFITVKNTQLQESGADYTYKQIKLLPTAAAGRKFVNFDNAAVKSLQSRLQLACPELQATTTTETGKRRKDGTPVTREVKYNQLDTCFESLDSLFILYDKMAKNKNKWKPSRSVKTNGIELHVLYETLNTKRLDSGPRKGQIQKQEGHHISPKDYDPSYDFSEVPHDIKDQYIRVHDPGNKAPFTWVTKNDEGKMVHGFISKREYNHRSKRGKVNRKHARDAENKMQITYAYLATFSLRTWSWPELRRAIKAFAHNHTSLHKFNSRKRWLKLKFEAKQAEQRTINHVINHVLRGKPDKRKRLWRKTRRRRRKKNKSCYTPKGYDGAKLVVIGDAGKMSGLKGTSCGAPLAKIKRLATQISKHQGWYIRVIDEAYTSKRSNCCKGAEMKCILTGHKRRTTKDGRTVRCTVHGISRCTSCLKLWNRDKSAALNQWDITSEIIRNRDKKARPWWLTKDMNKNRPLIPQGGNLDGRTDG